MLLSAAMMLDWLGTRHSDAALSEAAGVLEEAVRKAFGPGGVQPMELGGNDGTRAIAQAVLEHCVASHTGQ
jgi:3-isopropylmalate dehydrogenase